MAVINLSIYVANISSVIALFDQIQVFRSENGESGDYFEITAASATAAAITGSQTAPFNINGETLLLKVDGGSEQTVTFATADPVSVDNAIGEINGQTTDLTASEDTGAVVLTSDTTGTSSTLEITGGTALTDLGFTLDQYDNGEDARIDLVGGTSTYSHNDESGDSTYFYKTRYYNSSTQAVSSFSDPIEGDVGSIVASASLITAKIDLASIDGSPIADRRIVFYHKYVPPLMADTIAVLGKQVVMITDSAGHAEVSLVKGTVVDVSIDGTSIIREITVPSSGTEFNIMDEIATADDMFQIQVLDIPTAIRRS